MPARLCNLDATETRAMSKRSRTITRKIYFYRLADKAELLPLLPNELQRIENLPYNEHGRYLADGDEGRLIVWPDTVDYPLRIRFGRTRMANLPTK